MNSLINQLTLGSLFVSADEQNPVLDSSGTTGVIGQTVDTDDGSTIGNYWLFIVASILLLAVWLCCFCCVSGSATVCWSCPVEINETRSLYR